VEYPDTLPQNSLLDKTALDSQGNLVAWMVKLQESLVVNSPT
jgi:hypothetical protein